MNQELSSYNNFMSRRHTYGRCFVPVPGQPSNPNLLVQAEMNRNTEEQDWLADIPQCQFASPSFLSPFSPLGVQERGSVIAIDSGSAKLSINHKHGM